MNGPTSFPMPGDPLTNAGYFQEAEAVATKHGVREGRADFCRAYAHIAKAMAMSDHNTERAKDRLANATVERCRVQQGIGA